MFPDLNAQGNLEFRKDEKRGGEKESDCVICHLPRPLLCSKNRSEICGSESACCDIARRLSHQVVEYFYLEKKYLRVGYHLLEPNQQTEVAESSTLH